MASRPRRAAAQKANTAITDMVDSDNIISSRTGKIMSSRAQARRSEVKLPASKLRQATSSRTGHSSRQASLGTRESFEGGEILQGKRNRSQKKSYVVDSSDDDDDNDEDAEGDDDEDAEGEDDDLMDLGDEDAEGEIVVDDSMDLDLDAEGEDDDGLGDEDADGDEDDMVLDTAPTAPTIKVSKPKSAATSKAKAPLKSAMKQVAEDKDSDDELSELDSDEDEIQDTVKVGGGDDDDEEDEEEDAEGEDDDEIEAADATGQNDDELDSDEDGSRAGTPDLTKMTKRQRARFEDEDVGLMKLSDEVQAKKHFTAEELSMRRAEMARRRRNLSEKRNEEVKRETIDKLLKKQAPKTKGKGQLGGDETPGGGAQKPNPIFVRWVSNKDGARVAVPDEMLAGPTGKVFIPGGLKSGKMVEEVS
ncbi:hypothetical protein JX265_002979 [Neoarthrinium moseri]|uniref:INO80 complex subunit B-like conserved region domain-containing protein n=1 Tax=Neoarthrinium moseri TaxID=1658444 RepID=A0A9Q0ATM5_9PEZI|nr:uncharacterized protein JN550_006090 [Neoarthrinium moseri]KAI1844206.1 hypothetical protein JX266_009690 [Neoarthrinium moseri]KAI1869103.1 hypothetical protein JN550_006090 [Neoarthrinium moseri]KAI1878802.1 hypothetical protein JX265_002979 [Neoarthrinium moseri]